MPKRIITVAQLGLSACVLAVCIAAQAQTYPAKPVRWLVPSAAGGAFDVLTRALAPQLSEQTGQPFVVDNRGGAAGLLGMEQGARAAPDGYTILTAGTSQLIFNQFFHAKMPYDPLKDYAPIALLADLPIALWVHTSVPVKTFRELITYAKANPNKLNYGSAGVGHLFHLATEMLSERTGIQVVHVPYKGVGPAMQEFFAGRIQLLFVVAQTPVMNQYRAGKVLPLVGGTDKRLPKLPEVPTFDEMGVPGMEMPNWIGVVAPAGTPREFINRLNREMIAATRSPAAVKTYEGMAMETVTTSPEQLAQKIEREIRTWGPFIRKLGIKPE